MKSESNESLSLRRALETQLRDAEGMARVHRAAEAAARVPRDSLIARELVADVVGETFAGTLVWKLEKVPLDTHLIKAVRQRARRRRREQATFASLETLRESEVLHVHELRPDGDDRGEVDLADFPKKLDKLRFRVRGHSDALKLLALYEQGTVRRRDVRRLGMSVSKYRAARGLLMRIATEVWSTIPETPETQTAHPVDPSDSEAPPASLEPTSAVGLLLAATRLGPRRAGPSAPSARARRSV